MYIYGFSEILARISSLLPIDKQKWLVWHYTNKNVPGLNFWQRSHESIIACWKDKPFFNRDDVREPYTDAFLKNAAGKTRKSTKGRFSNGLKETQYTAHENGALPRDVIGISTLAGGAALKERAIFCKTCDSIIDPKLKKQHEEHELIIHPTQKPQRLTEKLILAARPATDDEEKTPPSSFSVLVPFAGSGAECLVSLRLGGSFIGFETNPDYQKLASALIGAG
jgi:site-specific DNA-methyltransferase (adenine-specific)